MPRYEVGDKVRVVDNLGDRERYYMDGGHAYNCSVSTMEEYRGKVVTIKSVASFGYSIEEDDYTWTDEMFYGLADDDDGQEVEIDEDKFTEIIRK